MKRVSSPTYLLYAMVFVILMLFDACNQEESSIIPKVTTLEVTDITQTTAVGGGKITGNAGVIQRGICWTVNTTPELDDSKTEEGSGDGEFSSTMEGLLPMTTYTVRAYAINNMGTVYGDPVNFTTAEPEGDNILFKDGISYGTVTDVDLNVYKTVKIGSQTWMAENLRTTHFNDGMQITSVSSDLAWGKDTIPAYCWYNNDSVSNASIYGALYNWYAIEWLTINQGRLSPEGWHVATADDWNELIAFLGGESFAGGDLKEETTLHWLDGNFAATNASGFTALPGGMRSYTGEYVRLGEYGYWWSSTEDHSSLNMANCRYIFGKNSFIYAMSDSKRQGYSIRCVKD